MSCPQKLFLRCNRTHSNDRALAWRKNKNRSLRNSSTELTKSCLLTLTGKKRRQCELPMTTDFDAPLRTQTIITDKVQGSSQRSQGVAVRYALTVDVPVPLRLQKRRYASDVFILLVFSSVRESIVSGSTSQVHETRRAKWGRCVFLFLHFRR